ncbi:MAG TPA: MarR family transcriptional regulator [Gaiellaceae bacterium]|nr:MarR family transcriptional regulator [Gaiellaceae bacterium]
MGRDDDVDYERAASLRLALQEFLRSSERITRAHGLTAERYQLLLSIKVASLRGDEVTVSDLASSLDLAKSTVTQLVRRAEDLGLIRRELSGSDARIRFLRLSEEGERRLTGAVTELGEERLRLISLLAPLAT